MGGGKEGSEERHEEEAVRIIGSPEKYKEREMEYFLRGLTLDILALHLILSAPTALLSLGASYATGYTVDQLKEISNKLTKLQKDVERHKRDLLQMIETGRLDLDVLAQTEAGKRLMASGGEFFTTEPEAIDTIISTFRQYASIVNATGDVLSGATDIAAALMEGRGEKIPININEKAIKRLKELRESKAREAYVVALALAQMAGLVRTLNDTQVVTLVKSIAPQNLHETLDKIYEKYRADGVVLVGGALAHAGGNIDFSGAGPEEILRKSREYLREIMPVYRTTRGNPVVFVHPEVKGFLEELASLPPDIIEELKVSGEKTVESIKGTLEDIPVERIEELKKKGVKSPERRVLLERALESLKKSFEGEKTAELVVRPLSTGAANLAYIPPIVLAAGILDEFEGFKEEIEKISGVKLTRKDFLKALGAGFLGMILGGVFSLTAIHESVKTMYGWREADVLSSKIAGITENLEGELEELRTLEEKLGERISVLPPEKAELLKKAIGEMIEAQSNIIRALEAVESLDVSVHLGPGGTIYVVPKEGREKIYINPDRLEAGVSRIREGLEGVRETTGLPVRE